MHHEANVVGLTVQWGGIAIVTILSFLMAQTARRQFLEYWTLSWACRTLSLTSLLIAFSLPFPPKVFYAIYFAADFAFAFLVVAGCRSHARGARLGLADAWVLAPGVAFALVLPYLSDDFRTLLIPSSAVLVGFWVTAFRTLNGRPRRRPREAGMRILRIALVMLAINSLHYAVVYSYEGFGGREMSFYLKYSFLYDLLLEILLAFGTVIFILESLCHQLEGENHYLSAAGAQLQALAEQDPLTGALNRHAFHAFHRRSQGGPERPVTGSVALVDVDDFKAINDRFGHPVGDLALRAVARSVRAVIRADDLLFRWGGDEFLVVLIGLGEAETRARLHGLNAALSQTSRADARLPVEVVVSCGVATFSEVTDLDRTIERADREMYISKQARKAGQAPPHVPADLPAVA